MEFVYNNEEVKPVEVVEEAVSEITEPAVVEQPKKRASKNDLVTVHSTKKVAWDGVGVLNVGLNTVTKENADKWIEAKYFVTLVEETNK